MELIKREVFKKRARRLLASLLLALLAELFIFNLRSITTLKNKEITLCGELWIEGPAEYESVHLKGDSPVANIVLDGLRLNGAGSISVQPMISDQGNAYAYSLPWYRIVPGVPESAYRDIYSYGNVREIYVYINVPEGASVHIDGIRLNIAKPFRIRPLRLLLLFIAISFIAFSYSALPHIPCKRKDPVQLFIIALSVIALSRLGWYLSSCNERLMEAPPEHHSQYQELTEALDEGHVDLRRKPASEELLAKENPYDTLALLAEGADFRMDYAYYEGKYYVYFGIVPELVFFYPRYKLKGEMLKNYEAMWRLYACLCAGCFLLLWELVWRYKKGDLPFFLYLAISWAFCLFSNFIFLVSRPDIYNIPLLAGCAFLIMGLGLCFAAAARVGWRRIPLLFFGGLNLALVAGCRPQFLLYALPLVFIFLFELQKQDDLGLKGRSLFTKKTVPDTIALLLPVAVVAVPVCWYNYARFGNILDFGATYSLTTNDMNLRGFNLDRLVRGLYAFLFQPPNTISDFPYLTSSILSSEYMGRNLTEFSFGGFLAACPLLLISALPLVWKRVLAGREQTALWLSYLISAVIIACFDVNGAGVLYRYSCDVAPGLLIAALILWIPLLSDKHEKAAISRRVFSLLLLGCLFYSLQCFCADGDVYSIYSASPALFERIRGFFA